MLRPLRSTLFPYTTLFRSMQRLYEESRHHQALRAYADLAKRPRTKETQNLLLLYRARAFGEIGRSEEHTSELQSQSNLVCRLLLEKKKKYINNVHLPHI